MPSWFEPYLELEQGARAVRTYECQVVPGLLQTPGYARALIELGRDRRNETDRRVELRMRRQELLSGPQAATLWAILDEAALRRPWAEPESMRAQLTHLIEQTERPNIRIQVAEFARGGHDAAGGSFTVLELPAPELSGLVYVEQLTSAVYLSERRDVEHYDGVMARLGAQLAPPEDTAALLADIRGR